MKTYFNVRNYLPNSVKNVRIDDYLGNLSNIDKAWIFMCVPILGLFVAPWLIYKGLQDKAKSSITLTYLFGFIAMAEFAYFHYYAVTAFFGGVMALILVGVYLYLIHTNQRHKSIMDVFGAINNYLASIGNKVARANQQLVNAQQALVNADKLTGDQFETFMVNLLNSVGFKDVKHTPFSGDAGLDAVGYLPDGKTKVGWQFKHYGNNSDMGYRAVEETVSGSCYYNTAINYTLTNGTNITQNAIENVQQIDKNMGADFVQIADRHNLFKLIQMNAKHLHFDDNLQLRNDMNQTVGAKALNA